jgi:Forkhead domain
MKPKSLCTCPQSGISSLQSGDAHSSRYSYSTHETAMETFHGLHGPEFDQSSIRRPTADFSRNDGNNLVYPTLYRQEPHAEWNQMHTMTYQCPKLKNPYEPSPSNGEIIQHDLFIREPNENLACEYTWSQSYGSGISMPTSAEPRLASEYLVSSLQQNCASEFTDFDGLGNVIMGSPADIERLSIHHSPTMGNQKPSDSLLVLTNTPALIDTSSSKASDDGEGDSGDGNLSAAEGRIPDAPYAKLIYKALMEAPNHSMVLQDIYQWFIDNTKKGNSASTGWRNSIRHNLSMNAVSDSSKGT